MAFDQLAVRKSGRGLGFFHCCKVPTDAVTNETLDLWSRHASRAPALGARIRGYRLRGYAVTGYASTGHAPSFYQVSREGRAESV
jgi:hypothetical protein